MFRFSDGFDSYAATADLAASGWISGTGWSWDGTSGLQGGGCLKSTTSIGNMTRTWRVGTTGTSRVYTQFWVKIASAPASDRVICMIMNGSLAIIGAVLVTSGGLLALANSASLTTGPVSMVQLCDNVWHHVELSFTRSTGTSNCTHSVWVDGTQVFDNQLSGGSFTDANGMSTIAFISVGRVTTFDDIILWDDLAGAGPTTVPLGVRRIDTIRPSGAGSSTQFTPNSGSNYAQVDDVASDGDTSYVSDAVSGHKDLYAFGNLGSTPSAITGVVVNVKARTDSGEQASVKLKAKSSTTEASGSGQSLAASYALKQEAFLVDPATSSAWTETGVNGAEFGLEVV